MSPLGCWLTLITYTFNFWKLSKGNYTSANGGSQLSLLSCSNGVCPDLDLASGLVIVHSPALEQPDATYSVITFGSQVSINWTESWEKTAISVVAAGSVKNTAQVFLADDRPENSSYSFSLHNDSLLVSFEGIVVLEFDGQSYTLENETVNYSGLAEGSILTAYDDRCSNGSYVDQATNECRVCPVHLLGTGLSDVCGNVSGCGEFFSCRGISYCPSEDVHDPVYGMFQWQGTTYASNGTGGVFVTEKCNEPPDTEEVATRECLGNQTWGTPNTTACLWSTSTLELQSILSDFEEGEQSAVASALTREVSHSTAKFLGIYDILIIYDIIENLLNETDGVTYDSVFSVITVMSHLGETDLCHENPACYWYKLALHNAIFSIKNTSTLIVGEDVGVFWTTSRTKLDIYSFCQGTFHDSINGCENDNRKFLKISENKLMTNPIDIKISLAFFQGTSFFPTSYLVSTKIFNDTVHDNDLEVSPNGTATVASMVVSVNMEGTDDSSTTLYFKLTSTVVYPGHKRYFNRNNKTYEVVYYCAGYETNNSLAGYLNFLGLNRSGGEFLSDLPILTGQKELKSHADFLGVWSKENCTTMYDSSSSDPIVRCDCSYASESFAIIAVIEEKLFPIYYVEVLWSMFGVCILAMVVGSLIIGLPPKFMGIPKTAKVNIAIVLVLILIGFLFLIVKMVYELRNFYF